MPILGPRVGLRANVFTLRPTDDASSSGVTVKTLLAQPGYPPDYSDEAIELVLKQTEIFAEQWATNG